MGFSLIFLRLNMKKLSGLSVSFNEDCEIGEVIFGISETDASRCFAKTVFWKKPQLSFKTQNAQHNSLFRKATNFRIANCTKREQGTSDFLWILLNYPMHLFYSTGQESWFMTFFVRLSRDLVIAQKEPLLLTLSF